MLKTHNRFNYVALSKIPRWLDKYSSILNNWRQKGQKPTLERKRQDKLAVAQSHTGSPSPYLDHPPLSFSWEVLHGQYHTWISTWAGATLSISPCLSSTRESIEWGYGETRGEWEWVYLVLSLAVAIYSRASIEGQCAIIIRRSRGMNNGRNKMTIRERMDEEGLANLGKVIFERFFLKDGLGNAYYQVRGKDLTVNLLKSIRGRACL